MRKEIFIVLFTVFQVIVGQILQFGECRNVKTMELFQIDKFLGKWYVIEKFPLWYEVDGHCAYKVVQLCGRRVRIQNGFVKGDIQYIIHVNSTYSSGDDAVFPIEENNVDPVGVPLNVISTDYTNYSVLYGCRVNGNLQLKYVNAWILSRSRTLSADLLMEARYQLKLLPDASNVYLKKENHSDCSYQWTAEIHALNINGVNDTVEETQECK
ncbi:lopap-like [Zerene cesonia]|uniref:lopap-like n=1 Tax=Zerene cesonia TaxID=33412 RepID=UPI0018E53644|nr:lopap-like [Zerene cesonia]